jgi:peptide/nickel transport system ATP-binding protein
MTDTLAALEALELTKRYAARGRTIAALDRVSLRLPPGRVVAVVGESGSGKSTLARILAGLETPDSGQVLLHGSRARHRGRQAWRRYTGQVQMIFQDPRASMNPLHSVRYHLVRPLIAAGVGRRQIEAKLSELLERVQLTPPDQFLGKNPHELSGGQCQRVAIARALAREPVALLADEPVSMLDVSIRLGILNVLRQACRESGVAVMYITHDIASARYFADDVLVMYGGRFVEGGPSRSVTGAPAHPYTRLLVDCVPGAGRDLAADDALPLPGSGAEEVLPARGCAFRPRCPHAMGTCAEHEPPREQVDGGQWARCWLLSRLPGSPRPADA